MNCTTDCGPSEADHLRAGRCQTMAAPHGLQICGLSACQRQCGALTSPDSVHVIQHHCMQLDKSIGPLRCDRAVGGRCCTSMRVVCCRCIVSTWSGWWARTSWAASTSPPRASTRSTAGCGGVLLRTRSGWRSSLTSRQESPVFLTELPQGSCTGTPGQTPGSESGRLQPCAEYCFIRGSPLLQGLHWTAEDVQEHQFPKLRLKVRENLVQLAGGTQQLPICVPEVSQRLSQQHLAACFP